MFSRWLCEAIHCSITYSADTLLIPLAANMFSPKAVKDIPLSVRAVYALEPSGRVWEKEEAHSIARVSAAFCMAEEYLSGLKPAELLYEFTSASTLLPKSEDDSGSAGFAVGARVGSAVGMAVGVGAAVG